MDTDQSELINLLNNDGTTLDVFCNYIANNAIKFTVTPVVSLGSLCLEAAIFKTLKNEFEKKGIDTTDFNPSTNFTVFFYKHAVDVVSVVSKLSPGTLSYYKYKSGIIDKLEALLIFSSIIIPIAMAIFYHITWHIIPLFIITIILVLINKKSELFKSDISGYCTIKDLVIGMKKRMESCIA